MSLFSQIPSDDGTNWVSIEPGADGRLVVPHAKQLFGAQFQRMGNDLRLLSEGEDALRVPDYFSTETPADIYAPNGAMLSGAAVSRLAGPLAPGQYAQASAPTAAEAIGQVETVDGTSSVQRADGTVEDLGVGVKIFANDVIQTAADSTVSVTFVDGTIFSLTSNSRMIIDNLIYDPESNANSGGFNLVQGGFVFIAGQVAKTGGMDVSTPSATMGIRGTTVIAEVQTIDGVLTTEVSLTRDPDGSVGEILLLDVDGNVVTNITGTDSKWILTASGEAFEVSRSLQDDADDNLLIAEAVGAYRSALARVDAGETFVSFGETRSERDSDGVGSGPGNGLELDSIDEPEGIDPGDAPEFDQQDADDVPFDEGRLRLEEEFLPPDTVVTGLEDPTEGVISGEIALDGEVDVTTLEFALLDDPQNGTATVTPDGQFEYVPSPNFNGQDQFTYQVTDGNEIDTSGTIFIELEPVNDAPEFADAAATVAEDGTLTGTLTATDVDGDALTYTLEDPAAHGGVVILEDGTYNYRPDPDYSGTDAFSVRVTDPGGASAVALVTVQVDGSNDVPVVVETGSVVAGDVTEDATDPLTGSLIATDADVGDTLTWSGSATGTYGTFEITAGGDWSYTLTPGAANALAMGAVETEQFLATVTDTAGTTDTQQVTITITGTNDGAELGGVASAAIAEDAGTNLVSGLLTSTDPDNADNAFQAVAPGAETSAGYGTYAVTAAGLWTYTLDNANADVNALAPSSAPLTDSFVVLTEDGTAQEVTVTITGANDGALIAGVSNGTIAEDAAVEFVTGLLTSTDADNADNAFQAVAPGAETSAGYGTFAVTAAGLWTYTLDNTNADVNALGSTSAALTDSFVVRSEDGTAQEVSITITGANDGAVVAGAASGTLAEDASVDFISGVLTSADADNADNAFQVVAPGAVTAAGFGTFAVTAAGLWTYTLDNANATVDGLSATSAPLTDSFTLRTEDGTEQEVTVTITGSNDAPTLTSTADDASGFLTESTDISSVTGQLTATDPDVGAVLTWRGGEAGTYGIFEITEGGTWIYTLSSAAEGLSVGETATETFDVFVSDGQGAEVGQTVTIEVAGTNQSPIVSATSIIETVQDTSVLGQLTATDAETASTDLIFALGSNGPAAGAVTVYADGSYEYTPDAGFQGVDRFDYTVTDADGGVSTARVEVEVESEEGGADDGRSATLDINIVPTDTAAGGSVAITTAQAETKTINLSIAMDRSGSIGRSGWEDQVDAVLDALDTLAQSFEGASTEVMVQIITYATTTIAYAPVELQDFDIARSTLVNSYESGSTRWDRALADAQDFFDAQNGTGSADTNYLFFITDGQPTVPPDLPANQGWQAISEDLRTDGGDGYTVLIEAFGIGAEYDTENPPPELTELAGSAPTFLAEPSQLTTALEASPVFNPVLTDFTLTLEVDGGPAQVIATEDSPTFATQSLEYEVALAEIADIYLLLGENNRFSATAQFDLDGDENTSEIELFSTEVLGIADTAQTLDGQSESDLLFGSGEGDRLLGGGGNDLIIGFGGDDTLNGGSGQDTILAGDGDDRILLSNAPTTTGERVEGGAGRDVLEVVGIGGSIDGDLLPMLDLSGIEVIDMDNAQANTFDIVSLGDVFDLSGSGDLEIADLLGTSAVANVSLFGDADDAVVLENTATTEFQLAEGVTVTDANGTEMEIYQYFGNGALLATLSIDAEVEVAVTVA